MIYNIMHTCERVHIVDPKILHDESLFFELMNIGLTTFLRVTVSITMTEEYNEKN